MALKTLGKTLLTGLVGLAGAASCIGVFVLFLIGSQSHFGGSHAFLAIAKPSLFAVVPVNLAAILMSIILTARKADWKYYIIPMSLQWVLPALMVFTILHLH